LRISGSSCSGWANDGDRRVDEALVPERRARPHERRPRDALSAANFAVG
jgi:hypothetical protein